MKIAIIGAGMAGLTSALAIKNNSKNEIDVSIYEKSRGVGRLATRYTEDCQFDFGAPYFRARSTEFAQYLQPYLNEGVLKQWKPKVASIYHSHNTELTVEGIDSEHPYYIGSPKMSSFGRALASQLDSPIQFKTHVARFEKTAQHWRLYDDLDNVLGEYDWVISAMPLEQAVELLPENFSAKKCMASCKTDACFSLMLGIAKNNIPENLTELFGQYGIIKFKQSNVLELAVNETQKHPQLADKNCYSMTVFSKNIWAESQLDKTVDEVKQFMLDELFSLLSLDVEQIVHADIHRWKYAKVSSSFVDVQSSENANSASSALIDKQNKLIAVGDWCVRGSVEGAWQSAQKIAELF